MNQRQITQGDLERMAELVHEAYAPADSQYIRPTVSVKIIGTTVEILDALGQPQTLSLGGGKYSGKIHHGELDPTDPAWLESPVTGDELSFYSDVPLDCYLLNYAEAGTSNHALEAESIVQGHVIGHTPDGRAVVALAGGGGAPASLPVGTRRAQVLCWMTDQGPWAADFVLFTGVV